MRKKSPSCQRIEEFLKESVKKRELRNKKTHSNFIKDFSIMSGVKKAVRPRIISKLKILDPIIFPRAILGLFSIRAAKLAKSSGAEVPIETRVRPMNKEDTFHFLAN